MKFIKTGERWREWEIIVPVAAEDKYGKTGLIVALWPSDNDCIFAIYGGHGIGLGRGFMEEYRLTAKNRKDMKILEMACIMEV